MGFWFRCIIKKDSNSDSPSGQGSLFKKGKKSQLWKKKKFLKKDPRKKEKRQKKKEKEKRLKRTEISFFFFFFLFFHSFILFKLIWSSFFSF